MSLGDLRALYQTSRWRRAAHAFLRLHPICARPACGQRATVVDHVVPRSTARDEPELQRLTWDRANWQGLCKSDHDLKTRRELKDLFAQVARFKLWWATHDGSGEVGE